jgi:hypothetical protein
MSQWVWDVDRGLLLLPLLLPVKEKTESQENQESQEKQESQQRPLPRKIAC